MVLRDQDSLSEAEKFQLKWMKQHGIQENLTGDRQIDWENQEKHKAHSKKKKPEKKRNPTSPDFFDPIEESLDLHGEDIETALFRVEKLLERARSLKFKGIRIIHGVGEGRVEKESLRLSIKRYLNTKAKGKIRSWTYENASEGSLVIRF